MGVQNPQKITISLVDSSGRSESGNVPLDPDRSYRTAAAYTPVTAPFKIRIVTLKNEAGSSAYHKNASQYWKYRAPIVFTGGRPPYRFTIVEGPAGMSIGEDGSVQVMNRALDEIGGGVYRFELPVSDSVLEWQPIAGDVGKTFKVKILVEDTLGNTLYNTHYITVGESPFMYVDINAANDSGAGTWAAPKKTFDAAHNNPNKICVYKTAGTYAVTFGGLNDSDNRSRQHIALVDGVNFDMSAEQFGSSPSSSTDVAFIGINFIGSMPTAFNARVFDLNSRTNRWLMWGCKWRNVTKGTNGSDNPACMFFGNLSDSVPNTMRDIPDNLCHTDVAMVGCNVDETVTVQMIALFSARNVKIEKCTGRFPASVDASSNGSLWINAKDSTSRICVQFNVAYEGAWKDPQISFLNQQAWFCFEQECSYNVIKVSDVGSTALGFNQKSGDTATVGIVANGQRLAAEDQRVIRNTFVCNSARALMIMYRWTNVAGMEPVIVEGNVCVTTGANIISTGGSNNDGYTLVGANPKLLPADVDTDMKLTGSARVTWLGKAGAEIASTLVT